MADRYNPPPPKVSDVEYSKMTMQEKCAYGYAHSLEGRRVKQNWETSPEEKWQKQREETETYVAEQHALYESRIRNPGTM